MTTYVDGGPADDPMPQCLPCADGECITSGYICPDWVCRCGCKLDADERARQADDRPTDKLHVIANELQRERDGDLRDLTAERFGAPHGWARRG